MRQNNQTIKPTKSAEKSPRKTSPKNSAKKSPRRSPKKAKKTEQAQQKVVPTKFEIMDSKTDPDACNHDLSVSNKINFTICSHRILKNHHLHTT